MFASPVLKNLPGTLSTAGSQSGKLPGQVCYNTPLLRSVQPFTSAYCIFRCVCISISGSVTHSVSHSLTVTKMQDQTRKITGIILDWFGKVWVVKFGLVRPSLVWFGLVKFHFVPVSIPILIPIQIPVTFPI